MAIYYYTAKKMDGTKVKGQLQAADEDQVYHHLKHSGLYLIKAKAFREKIRTKRMSASSLENFSREIAVMQKSAIPFVHSLNMLCRQEQNPGIANVYQELYLSLAQGNDLSEAMESLKGVFPVMMIQMVKAGEESGQMAVCMEKLADYYERDARLKRQFLTSMAYPAFLVGLTVAAILIIFVVVLPSFFELFQLIGNLPLSTKVLMGISDVMIHHSPEVAVWLAVSVILGAGIYKNPRSGVYVDRLFLKTPLMGGLIKRLSTARFARSLDYLYSSGVPILQAVAISAGILENRYLARQLNQAGESLKSGISLSAVFGAVDGLDSRLSLAVFLGEESGELHGMLSHVADSFEHSSEETLRKLTALAEPIVIVCLAVVIGIVMLSVMIPIYRYYQMLG